MKSFKFFSLIALLLVLSFALGCSPQDIDSTGGLTGGGGGTNAFRISVTLTDVATGATITSISSPPGSVNVNATVRDAQNNLISGATVTFSVSNGSAGSFGTQNPATTNASGVATARFDASALSGGVLGYVVTLNASAASAAGTTVNAGGALKIGNPPPPVPADMALIINPLSINILSQSAVSVTVLDGSGGPAFSTDVLLSIATGTTLASFSSGTTQLSTTLTTNGSGVASATIYAGSSSGIVTVQATAGSITKSASFEITSDPAYVTVDAVTADLTTSQSTNIIATVSNVMHNPVPNGTVVTFKITAGATNAGSLSQATASTVNGIATVTFNAHASNTGSLIITASAGPASGTTLVNVSAANAVTVEYVSVTPSSGIINIQGAGPSDAFVVFRVLDTSGHPLSGVTVNFTLFGPYGATLDTGTTTSTGTGPTDINGQATTILHAGKYAGPVRIAASIPGFSTSSGPISIGGGMPSMRYFSLSVQKFNVAGLHCDGATDTINVKMADRFGNYNIIKGTSVSFTNDYGAIDTGGITDDAGQTSAIWRSQELRPPSSAKNKGKVAILVQTNGEEHFIDNNADGVFTSGTDTLYASDDLPEPFIDTDDFGTFTAGDLYFDWPPYVIASGGTGTNPNGVYDGPNGRWDSKIPIFKNVNIWMTGPPDPYNSGIVCLASGGTSTTANITIPNGSSTECYIIGSDENGNALVGGTTVSLKADNTAATVTWSSGFETYADHQVAGPERTGYTVSNKNTSGSPVNVTLTGTINWPGGGCGGLKVTYRYPGTVTLSP